MKIQKPSYEEIMKKSNSVSWWYFVPVFLKEVGNTISIMKNKLKDDEKFNSIDLIQLRTLYKELRDSSVKNKDSENYNGVQSEKTVSKSILDIINQYYSQTNISVGIQKRMTKSRYFTPGMPGMVTSYYYKVGKIPEYALLNFEH